MNALNGYDVEDLSVGMTASFAKTITEADIVLFAGASGDNNAVHINEEFAATTSFKGRIAHGMLSASVISAAIAIITSCLDRAPSICSRAWCSRLPCAPGTPCMRKSR